MSLSDSELCKKIAEIEGFDFRVQNGKVLPGSPSAVIESLTDVYNPLTNKALLFDLMVKYEVCICRYFDKAYILSDYTDREHKASVSFSIDSDIERAILECIVEANS